MKKIIRATASLVYICINVGICFGQKDTVKLCNPKLEGMGRSKAFNISYEKVFSSNITTTSKDPSLQDSSGTIKANNRFEISLRLPIWNRPRLKAVLGFKYTYEEFRFSPDPTYDIYKNLQDKNLKSIGLNLNILKPIDAIHYILFRSTFELNGDYNSKTIRNGAFLRYNVAALFGWKPCPTRTTAVGLLYSYAFGRQSIIPAIVYSNTFNRKWGIEAVVPVDVKMRRNFSEKTLLYLGYSIQGNGYNIEILNPPLANYSNLELRKSV